MKRAQNSLRVCSVRAEHPPAADAFLHRRSKGTFEERLGPCLARLRSRGRTRSAQNGVHQPSNRGPALRSHVRCVGSPCSSAGAGTARPACRERAVSTACVRSKPLRKALAAQAAVGNDPRRAVVNRARGEAISEGIAAIAAGRVSIRASATRPGSSARSRRSLMSFRSIRSQPRRAYRSQRAPASGPVREFRIRGIGTPYASSWDHNARSAGIAPGRREPP